MLVLAAFDFFQGHIQHEAHMLLIQGLQPLCKGGVAVPAISAANDLGCRCDLVVKVKTLG
jgi:hypothetical protein